MSAFGKVEDHAKVFGVRGNAGSSKTYEVLSHHLKINPKSRQVHLSDGGREANRLAKIKQENIKRR